MKYLWLLLAVLLVASCADGPSLYSSLEGVPRDVRTAIDLNTVRGYSGKTYTIVTFQDGRSISFEGLSPTTIPIDRHVKIFYNNDKIMGVKLVTPQDINQVDEYQTTKGPPKVSD